MAKVHFFYSAMNAGKTTSLLQIQHNYHTDGYKTLLLKPSIDDRFDKNKIVSRIGLEADAIPVSKDQDIIQLVKEYEEKYPIKAIFLDEAQFFTKEQILAFCHLADFNNISILAFGLKTNFKGELFEGSQTLIQYADELKEIKKLCHCSKKATMVLRYNKDGDVLKDGEEIEIGAEDRYVSVCRKHFFNGDIGNNARQNLSKTCDKINKRRFASIISQYLNMSFDDAINYAENNKVDMIKKLNNDINHYKSLLNEKSTNGTLSAISLSNVIVNIEHIITKIDLEQ